MRRHIKNLLSGKVFEGVALTQKLLKIKPKVTLKSASWRIEGFRRFTKTSAKVTFISLLLIFLAGYYPILAFPPVKSVAVLAYALEQKGEIVASFFDKPPMLPHPGYLSTKFSRWHPGVDIASGFGMPVHPITAGVVEEVEFSFWGYGNHVIVSHPNGFKSLYGHLSKVYAKKGQPVSSENTLGEVGMTGFTSGPHTHLEIQKDGKFIDPQTLLPEIPDFPKPEYISQQSRPLK